MRISYWSSDVCSSDLIVTPEQVAKEHIRIIAPHGFSEEATAENVLAGGAMGRRALYMFGAILAPWPTGQDDTGLGPKLSSGTIGYMEPTETVPAAGATLIVDGLQLAFIEAGRTEAPREVVFYHPAIKDPNERRLLWEREGETREN